jgi:hypothetical protein
MEPELNGLVGQVRKTTRTPEKVALLLHGLHSQFGDAVRNGQVETFQAEFTKYLDALVHAVLEEHSVPKHHTEKRKH